MTRIRTGLLVILLCGVPLMGCREDEPPPPPPPVKVEEPDEEEGRVYWSNDQIIEETKKCEDAGLKAQPLIYKNKDGSESKTASIQCIPYED